MSTTIGERIKILRGESTQEQFANKISVSRQYVSLLESGEREPSSLLVHYICQRFHVRREWLLLGIEPKYTLDAYSIPEQIIPDVLVILESLQHIIDCMPPAGWDRLKSFLDTVTGAIKDPEA